jgi:PEP-CTERM motif
MLFVGVAASANTVEHTYSTESAFLSAILPEYYLQTFSTKTSGQSLSYSGDGYSYTASVTGGLLPRLQTDYGWMQETNAGDTITITFKSGDVTAVGGDFFAVNLVAQPKSATITLNFAGGPSETITSTTSTTAFTGFTFEKPLTSMTITPQSSILAARYAALDNLVIGTAAPEPGTWMLLSAGVGLMALARFRRSSRF